MNKFKFRLHKVENNKENQVKQKSHKLAELFYEQERLREKIQHSQNEMTSVQKENLLRTVEGCSVNELSDSQKYIKKLNDDIKVKNEELESLDGQIEDLQVTLLKLDKEKMIWAITV